VQHVEAALHHLQEIRRATVKMRRGGKQEKAAAARARELKKDHNFFKLKRDHAL